MRTRAVPARPTSSCTAPSPIVNPAFVHSTGLPPPSRVSGVARSTTRPSRSSRSAKHPACSASTSTSPSYHWSFSAPYIHTQLRSLPHHVSDCELPIPHDRTAMALFSAARSTSAPIPEFGCRTSRGGVRAARGVSSWLWFRCLRFPGAAWCKEAPDGGSFSCFCRESPPRAHPDRRPDLCDGFCRPAGLRSPEFHFGQFASRAWRLLGGRKKKSEVFASLRERVRSFFNSAFWNRILHPPDGP